MFEDLAWAAGLFEGEGCINQNRCNGGRYQYPRLVLATTDEDVIQRFACVVQCGKVTGPLSTPTLPQYRWVVHAWDDCVRLLALFWPFLGARRKAKALEVLQYHGPMK